MGVSSDGVLYFGFQVGGEDEKPEWLGEHDDMDEFVDEKAGVSGEEYEKRKAVREACPADLGLFCSFDYPMYVLFVRGAEHRAYRGDIVELGSEELAVSEEKISAFRAWCGVHGIEYQEPKWLLCSMYG